MKKNNEYKFYQYYLKYPKFFILFLTFILAYIIFANRDYAPLEKAILNFGLFGAFILGALYTYGFTAVPATATLLIFGQSNNILIIGLVAGLGALLADLLIFSFIKLEFYDEISLIKKEKSVVYISKKLPPKFKKSLILILGLFIIASPLPDELGITLLSFSKIVTYRLFSLLSYILNTTGILIILWIGRVI